jgi:hypothetical protein
MWIEDDRVEGIAARFDPDAFEHGVPANEFERDAVDKGLGYRLDREWVVHVANGEELSADRRYGNTKLLRIDGGEFGNIIGKSAAPIWEKARMGGRKNVFDAESSFSLFWLGIHGQSRIKELEKSRRDRKFASLQKS